MPRKKNPAKKQNAADDHRKTSATGVRIPGPSVFREEQAPQVKPHMDEQSYHGHYDHDDPNANIHSATEEDAIVFSEYRQIKAAGGQNDTLSDGQDTDASDDPNDTAIDDQNGVTHQDHTLITPFSDVMAELTANWGITSIKDVLTVKNWFKEGKKKMDGKVVRRHEPNPDKWHRDTRVAILNLSRLTEDNLTLAKKLIDKSWNKREHGHYRNRVQLQIGATWKEKESHLLEDINLIIEGLERDEAAQNPTPEAGAAQQATGPQTRARTSKKAKEDAQAAHKEALSESSGAGGEEGKYTKLKGKGKGKGKGKKVDDTNAASGPFQSQPTAQDGTREVLTKRRNERYRQVRFEEAEDEGFRGQNAGVQQGENEPIVGPSTYAALPSQGHPLQQQIQPQPGASRSELRDARYALEDAQHRRHKAELALETARTNRALVGQELIAHNDIMRLVHEAQQNLEVQNMEVTIRRGELQALENGWAMEEDSNETEQ